MNPKVSVVIGVYNGEPLFEETLKSVFAQTYTNYEIVVVDDGSTDGTAEMLSRYQARPIRVIRHSKNRGISAAINTAMTAVTGDYVAFLDHDDIWYPDKLLRQVDLFRTAPWIDFCFTDCLVFGDVEQEYRAFDERDRAVRRYAALEIAPGMFEIIEESFLATLCDVQFPPFCPMIRTDSLRRVLPLDEDITAQDVQVVFRIANQVKLGYVDCALWARRVRLSSWGHTMGRLRWIEAHVKTLERLPKWTSLTAKERAAVQKLLAGYLRFGGYAALDEGLMERARQYYWKSLRLEGSPRDALYWIGAHLSPAILRSLRAFKQRVSSVQSSLDR